MTAKKVCIVGMGPAGLMAGTQLLLRGYDVHFFDHKKAAGRKFLVAGHGGFNLTHSEPKELFVEKYNRPLIQEAFQQFDNEQWIAFLRDFIGIETFVGSSGKIFPVKGIKPIEVLDNWLVKLKSLGSIFHYSHSLLDFDRHSVTFLYKEKTVKVECDRIILAMGGASWTKTGSTGEWLQLLQGKNIPCLPFQSSNSGFEMENWEKASELEGQTLKNVEIQLGGMKRLGDVVISNYGLEGAPIYYVNSEYRENRNEMLKIDLKPTKNPEEIISVLRNAKNTTEGLKNLKLSKTVIQLIKLRTNKEEFSSPEIIANRIKGLTFQITSQRPIDEVISTVGGISLEAVSSTFELKNWENVYAVGEMLDWDAPTGGYLIQGCVSTGFVVGTKMKL